MFLTRLVSATGLLPSPGKTGWVLAPTHLTPPKPSGGDGVKTKRTGVRWVERGGRAAFGPEFVGWTVVSSFGATQTR